MDVICCGKCKYHVPIPPQEWTCNNGQSDNYGFETEYEDTCDDFEERE